MCPPFYNFVFEGLDPDAWDVNLYSAKGDLVPSRKSVFGNSVVLSFRPTKEQFKEGGIGDFELIFASNGKQKAATTKVRARLEMGQPR